MFISLLETRLKCEAVMLDRKLIVVTSRWLTVVPVLLLVTLSNRLSTLPVVTARTKWCPRLAMYGMHNMSRLFTM